MATRTLDTPTDVTVAVVGAGPAGVGVACALHDAGIDDVVVLERDVVGASLRRWPREMRAITPSFTANVFGAVDLNAITPTTSPAHSLDVEHPSGSEWATYLTGVVNHFRLNVRTGVDVREVAPLTDGDGYLLNTSDGIWRTRFVIWAAGEFGSPRTDAFPGADICRPAGTVTAWEEIRDRSVVIVGGAESGIDAAVTLIAQHPRRRVLVLDTEAPWEIVKDDPSVMLTPYTRQRLRDALATGRLELRGATTVTGARSDGSRVVLSCADGSEVESRSTPILAAGYRPQLGPVRMLFEIAANGLPDLTEHDESTCAPGLFLAGPSVRHDGLIFCFAYKYRGRFPVIAERILSHLGQDPGPAFGAWRAAGMHIDDLSCCGDDCTC